MSENNQNTVVHFDREDAKCLVLCLVGLAALLYTPLFAYGVRTISAGAIGFINALDAAEKALGQQWAGFLFFGVVLSCVCMLVKSKRDAVLNASGAVLFVCFFAFMAKMFLLSSGYESESFVGNTKLHALSVPEVQSMISKSSGAEAYVGTDKPQRIASGDENRLLKTACEDFQREFLARPQWSERYVMFINGERVSGKPLKCSFWSKSDVVVAYTPTYAPNGLVALLEKQSLKVD